MSFSKEMATGRTGKIVVKVSEYKGSLGIDVRKYYNDTPTKKGAFLVTSQGQHEFVLEALPKTLADNQERRTEGEGNMDLVVRRYDYNGMEGYSVRKEAKSGTWGKGIWLNPDQAKWVAEQIAAATETL